MRKYPTTLVRHWNLKKSHTSDNKKQILCQGPVKPPIETALPMKKAVEFVSQPPVARVALRAKSPYKSLNPILLYVKEFYGEWI